MQIIQSSIANHKTVPTVCAVGFTVPIDTWLRNPLRDWGRVAAGRGPLEARRHIPPGAHTRKVGREHLAHEAEWQPQIWNILMFQSWLEHESA